jgi:hypothetical protein
MEERICNELLENSAALAVMLVDADWREVARAGASLLDADTLALLRANASRLGVEREVIGRFDNTAKRQFHLSLVAGQTLIVVFDDGTSLGLVRLRAKKAAQALNC